MRRTGRSVAAAALAIGLWTMTAGAEREADVTSRWRDVEISIDGSSEEWPELARLGKTPLSAAFVNDDDALYVCVITSDPGARRQILRRGLQLWLDATVDKKKKVGVRFPAPPPPPEVAGQGRGPGGGQMGEPPPMPEGGREGEGAPVGGELEIPSDLQERVEILAAKDEDRRLVNLDDVPGMEAKVTVAEGRLVWEARIPLAPADGLWSLTVPPGTMVGLGFETATPGRPAGGGMGPGGGMRPGGGIGPGGMGPGGMGGGGRRTPDAGRAIRTWVTLQLATQS